MLTHYGIPPEQPMLLGMPILKRDARDFYRPTLRVEFACVCHQRHEVDWFEHPHALRLDAVITLKAPCAHGLLSGREIAVGLDQTRAKEIEAVFEHFKSKRRGWEAEQRFRLSVPPSPHSRAKAAAREEARAVAKGAGSSGD